MVELTQLLHAAHSGDHAAAARLIEAVYPDLRALAVRHLRGQRAERATSLVHEAWLRLAPANLTFRDRGHFFAVTSRVMRQILINHARHRMALKRGAGAAAVSLEAAEGVTSDGDDDATLLGVDAALARLEALDERLARVVELRFYGGLLEEEIAEVLELSVRSVQRDWRRARAFLASELAVADA